MPNVDPVVRLVGALKGTHQRETICLLEGCLVILVLAQEVEHF